VQHLCMLLLEAGDLLLVPFMIWGKKQHPADEEPTALVCCKSRR
jgi:hypothetical protein